MKKKRIMILGARESGKTLLANYLNEIDTPPKRTPHMVYGRNTLDVPGSYVESNDMHKHLIAAQQAKLSAGIFESIPHSGSGCNHQSGSGC